MYINFIQRLVRSPVALFWLVLTSESPDLTGSLKVASPVARSMIFLLDDDDDLYGIDV